MTCYGCFSSQADVVALRVGSLFGNTQIARIDLCGKCRLLIWTNWGDAQMKAPVKVQCNSCRRPNGTMQLCKNVLIPICDECRSSDFRVDRCIERVLAQRS